MAGMPKDQESHVGKGERNFFGIGCFIGGIIFAWAGGVLGGLTYYFCGIKEYDIVTYSLNVATTLGALGAAFGVFTAAFLRIIIKWKGRQVLCDEDDLELHSRQRRPHD